MLSDLTHFFNDFFIVIFLLPIYTQKTIFKVDIKNGGIKKMKKLAMILLTSLLCLSVFAKDKKLDLGQDQANSDDNFNPDPGAYIIDTDSIPGSFRDEIDFINLSEDSQITFLVYASNSLTEDWVQVGAVHLDDYGDDGEVESEIPNSLYTFRYFKVEPTNENKYYYDTSKSFGDLIIKVKS